MKNVTFFKRAISGYGWLLVGSSTLVMVGFYGTELSFGVFLKPLIEEFGWTRAMVSGAMSTVEGIGGLVGIIMGRLTDRYGARMLIGIGALSGGLGYLLMSKASSLWQLYLYFGIMVGICISSCWTPINVTISRRFVEKRFLALSITTSGMRIGHMLVPPLIAYYITVSGWRFAYILMAIIVWIAAIPAVMFLGKGPPQDIDIQHRSGSDSDRVDDRVREPMQLRGWSAMEAAKTTSFWMLIVTGFVIAASYLFVTVHIVAYATDTGITTTSAALILTIMGVSSFLGNLLVWPITVKIGARFAFILLLALQTLALFLLIRATSLWMFLALGSVFGFGLGGNAPIRMSMVSEFFGMRSLGTIMGIISLSWAVGGIIGPILAGYIYDLSLSYDMAFLGGAMLMIVGIVSAYFLKAPDRQPLSL